MARLLVSVRTAAEARTAVRAGADIIDVKEPAHGTLGRADDAVIREVVAVTGGRPVSVALGELVEAYDDPLPPLDGVRYAKVGLAGCAGRPDWPALWHDLQQRIRKKTRGRTQLIAAAYADADRARAPAITEVIDKCIAAGCTVLMIDTWAKDGRGLLEWIGPDALAAVSARCADAGMELAVAGSIAPEDLTELHRVGPTIVGVRGAVCRRRQRNASVEDGRVRRLARLVHALGPTCDKRPAVLVGS